MTDRNKMLDKINEASNYLKENFNSEVSSAIILGSGMGGFENSFDPIATFDYSEIPNFIKPAVQGHSGTLTFVEVEDKIPAILSGRAHYYEGYDIHDLVLPTRVLATLGIKNLIVTNAAGGINDNYSPGDIVAIKDHINLTGNNPLIGKNLDEFGPRFPDMSEVYCLKFRDLAKEVSKEYFEYKEGVYAWFTGPTYETPSEIKKIKSLGGDVIGMSTMPEIIKANEYGMNVIGLSCLSNYASGISKNPLTHKDVLNEVNKSKNIFTNLLSDFIKLIKE